MAGEAAEPVEVLLPAFVEPDGTGSVLRRGVPARRVGGHLVTTVYDLMLAQYGVERPGLPGSWPTGYDDVTAPYTPAWQAEITGVPAEQCIRIAREFATNSEQSQGRSMIIMGAGICQWFHGDATYRAILSLLILTGCMGRNGGGWAHYVGQEKCRPITGWISLANALDWGRPPRTMTGTSYWYMHTDQWRNDGYSADSLNSPLARGHLAGKHTADTIAQSARMGWMPFYPQFGTNPLQVAEDAQAAVDAGTAASPAAYVAGALHDGTLTSAIEDVDAPENWPRTLVLWRSNLMGSSAKGNEYFLRNLLGTHHNVLGSENPRRTKAVRGEVARRGTRGQARPAALGRLPHDVDDPALGHRAARGDVVREARPQLDRHAPVRARLHPRDRPAVGGQERLRALPPAGREALGPRAHPPRRAQGPRQRAAHARHRGRDRATGWASGRLARDGAAGCARQDDAGLPARRARLHRDQREARHGGPARRHARLHRQERDLPGRGGGRAPRRQERRHARRRGDGRPAIDTDEKLAEAILTFSGTTNGHLAVQGFRTLEERVGRKLVDLAEGSEEKRITFADTQVAPVAVITSPEWSGSETGGRRYAPFTVNIERLKPFHTLTGRMHFYLDHDWMQDLGEALPIYRPPLDMHRLFGEPKLGPDGSKQVTVRYLTPHSKWSIHSEYQDNLLMLSLSRGGPTVWMSPQDAGSIDVKDNDWVECLNTNGVLVGRAIVSSRMPEGVVFVHHAQERTIDVPKSEATGRRGGIHNSVTRLLVKPTHLIGGYAQLSYTFNYLGPTGNQRDMVSTVRKRSQEVTY